MKTLQVDLELVKKYNSRPGRVIRAYPPATKFTESTTVGAAFKKIEANNRTTRDLSIYFHIPFCETLCWFCGCTTVITTNFHDKGHDYINYLGREVAAMVPKLNPARKVAQLQILAAVRQRFASWTSIRQLGDIITSAFQIFAEHRSERRSGPA